MKRTSARALTSLIFLLFATTGYAIDGTQANEIAQQQVTRTLEALPTQGWHEWLAAVNELSRAPTAATPALLQALGAPERSIRTAAAQALAARVGLEDTHRRAAAAGQLLELAGAPTEELREAYRSIASAASKMP